MSFVADAEIIVEALSDFYARSLAGTEPVIHQPPMRELIARVKTVLKRCSQKEEPLAKVLKFPDLQIDIDRHEVLVAGKPVELTAKEFTLLRYLAENNGRAIGRETLSLSANSLETLLVIPR